MWHRSLQGAASPSPAASGTAGAHDHSLHGADVTYDAQHHYHYTHGGYAGHVLPGFFFLLMGTYWLFASFINYFRSTSKAPFTSRSWSPWPFPPRFLARVPLEPVLKIVFPIIGICGELTTLGHEEYQNLYDASGQFDMHHINDWQHATMYLAFLASGVVDLLDFYLRLPDGLTQAFLAQAFMVEALLLGFHLKGPQVEITVHILLVIATLGTVLLLLFEAVFPHSVLLAGARCTTVALQGSWWIQIAHMMFESAPEWDPAYMGSSMVAPVLFSLHAVVVSCAGVLVFCFLRCVYGRKREEAEEEEAALSENEVALELSRLLKEV